MKSYTYYFLIRSYQGFFYLERSLKSVLAQSRRDYTILFVDDASSFSAEQKKRIQSLLTGHIVIFNKQRKYSLRNGYEMIHNYVKEKNAIVISLDGDDWLIRNDVIDVIEKKYLNCNCLLTYGNGLLYQPGNLAHLKPISMEFTGCNIRYPKDIEVNNSYRKHSFKCLQLITWKAELFKQIPKKYFMRSDGSWIQFCQDYMIMLALLEMAGGRYEVIQKPLCAYNLHSPLNDRKAQIAETFLDELTILKQEPLKQLSV